MVCLTHYMLFALQTMLESDEHIRQANITQDKKQVIHPAPPRELEQVKHIIHSNESGNELKIKSSDALGTGVMVNQTGVPSDEPIVDTNTEPKDSATIDLTEESPE